MFAICLRAVGANIRFSVGMTAVDRTKYNSLKYAVLENGISLFDRMVNKNRWPAFMLTGLKLLNQIELGTIV